MNEPSDLERAYVKFMSTLVFFILLTVFMLGLAAGGFFVGIGYVIWTLVGQ